MADIISIIEGENTQTPSPISSSQWRRTLAIDHYQEYSPAGPSQIHKQVVVVMDGLREFSWEPLEWVLKNVADGGGSSSCKVTLLGVKPWLNIPLFSKTSSDFWSIDLDELSLIRELRNDANYHIVRVLLDICQHYGVVLEIRTEMGHPLHLLVLEAISSLHATLVVFDRHHDRKYIEFYAEKVPCNMVKMREDGQVEAIKIRRVQSADSTPRNDASSVNVVAPSSRSAIFSEKIKKLLKQKHDKRGRLGRNLQDGDEDDGTSVVQRVVSKSKSVILTGQIKKLLKRKYESFGKKNNETAAFSMCLNGIKD
ncbi:OLC1v1031283C1 [Oldenlandia corymbosa var. corymbosa]|uniref:OLC1v1031283C1 n=1 Tax=Oldenlandia corymbosa var. corymbosa TaxID=529605 RepID=A0AAV1CL01_OLDCO|nr:OLC1v1031283C1 [Oldenlandia corymbosa var. corymbosa]